jgi:hypothetical protein
MRKLTEKQKRMLDKLCDENPSALCFEDMPNEKIRQIEKMTDNELAYQQINRFISDRRMKEIYGY